jgi:hypothetical protein
VPGGENDEPPNSDELAHYTPSPTCYGIVVCSDSLFWEAQRGFRGETGVPIGRKSFTFSSIPSI